MNHSIKSEWLALSLVSSVGLGLALTPSPAALAQGHNAKTVPFAAPYWELQLDQGGTSRFVTYEGEESLCLRGGYALPKNAELAEGTIEYQVSFGDSQGFIGAFFHAADTRNHERFFMRPLSSGTGDAIQYTPVFGGVQSWKLFYGQGFNGKFSFDFGNWTPVRLDIADNKMAVYVGDLETPLYVVPELKRNLESGRMGLFALNPRLAEGCFSNFRYSTAKPDLSFIPDPQPSTDPGLITSWEVSAPVDPAQFEGRVSLEGMDWEEMEWQTLETDRNGILNLTPLYAPKAGQNAVVLRLEIPATEEKIQAFDLGYSDFATVYHNGRAIFTGNNRFQSREEWYIGTIGFYEKLYLPLEKGTNEVVIVLTANATGTAGWGMMGRLQP